MSLLSLQDLTKSFGGLTAVNGVSFVVEEGTVVGLIGPNGAGKTTVFNLITGNYRPDRGRITFADTMLNGLRTHRIIALGIARTFQNIRLFQNLTALENVELASEICKEPLDAALTLQEVELGDRMGNFPAQLSGGEQQRVSIARALAKNPKLLLCDEPTGALDYQTGKAVLRLLQDTCRNTGRTVIVITHNTAITAMADRIIRVKSGAVLSNERNLQPVPVEEIEW